MATNGHGHRSEQPAPRDRASESARDVRRDDLREEAESEAQQSNFFSGEGTPRAWENRGHRDAWSDGERERDRAPRARAPEENPQRPHEPPREKSRFWHREPLTAREVMTSDVRGVSPDAGIEEMARLMRELDVGILPVVDVDRRLLGVVTDRDLVVRGLAEPEGTRKRAVDLASKELQTIASDTPIPEILELMGKRQVRRVPVVDVRGVLLGMVSVGDIAQRADQDEELQHALQRISGRRSFWSRLWG